MSIRSLRVILLLAAAAGAACGQPAILGDLFAVNDQPYLMRIRSGAVEWFPVRSPAWPVGAKRILHDDQRPGRLFVASPNRLLELDLKSDHAASTVLFNATLIRGLCPGANRSLLVQAQTASAGGPWEIWRIDIATGTASYVAPSPASNPTGALVFSPADGRLFVADGSTVAWLDPTLLTTGILVANISDPAFNPAAPAIEAMLIDPFTGDLVCGDQATQRLLRIFTATGLWFDVDPNPSGTSCTQLIATDPTGLFHCIRNSSTGSQVEMGAYSFSTLGVVYTWSLPPAFPIAANQPFNGSAGWAIGFVGSLPYGCVPVLLPASVASFGVGNGGPLLPPPLLGVAGGTPFAGNQAFGVVLTNASPGVAAGVLVAPGLDVFPSVLPGGGALLLDINATLTLLAQGINPYFVGVTDASGTALWPNPVPSDPCVVGVQLAFQAYTADAMGIQGYVFPYTITNAIQFQVGY